MMFLFSYLSILVIFVILFVIAVSSKRKGREGQTSRRSRPQVVARPITEWPDGSVSSVPPRVNKQPRTGVNRTYGTEFPAEVSSTAMADISTEARAREKAQAAKAAKASASSKMFRDSARSTRSNDGSDAETEGRREFSEKQKLIIYSEIMNPKFDS